MSFDCHDTQKKPATPHKCWDCGLYSPIQIRKIKFSSIQFCIGDLVLFDFIYFQLSYLYGLFLLVLSICYQEFAFLSFYCPGRVSAEKSRRLPFPLSVHIIPHINYSVWMAEKKGPCTVFSKAVQSPFPSFFSYASPFSSNQLSRVLFPLFILRVRIWNSRMVSRVKTIHKTVRNITAS